MILNDYKVKANSYALLTVDSGTISIAYREFAALLNKYATCGKKAIDFGCGSGRSRKYLEEMGFDAEGFDIDINMIKKAKELDINNAHKYKLINGYTIPERDSKYDLVFSSLVVLELENKQEINNYFSEAYRVMKFDGTFIVLTVSDHFYKYPWYSIETHYSGNKEAKSGDRVKVKIKETDLELNDFYWTKEDYRSSAIKNEFTIVEEIEPLGYESDEIEWVTECKIPPYTIFVMKKTKSLINISTIPQEKAKVSKVF